MTDEELARLEVLAVKATPGPWTWEQEEEMEMDLGDTAPYALTTLYAMRNQFQHGLNLLGRLRPDANGKENLNFIASSRFAIPDLIAALRAERKRAIESETWSARLANDRENESARIEIGVARAMDAIRDVLNAEQDSGEARAALILGIGAIKGRCGLHTLSPHEATLARLRKLEAVLAKIVNARFEDRTHPEALDWIRAEARAALKDKPS